MKSISITGISDSDKDSALQSGTKGEKKDLLVFGPPPVSLHTEDWKKAKESWKEEDEAEIGLQTPPTMERKMIS